VSKKTGRNPNARPSRRFSYQSRMGPHIESKCGGRGLFCRLELTGPIGAGSAREFKIPFLSIGHPGLGRLLEPCDAAAPDLSEQRMGKTSLLTGSLSWPASG